jgi:hypothetical protein
MRALIDRGTSDPDQRALVKHYNGDTFQEGVWTTPYSITKRSGRLPKKAVSEQGTGESVRRQGDPAGEAREGVVGRERGLPRETERHVAARGSLSLRLACNDAGRYQLALDSC